MPMGFFGVEYSTRHDSDYTAVSWCLQALNGAGAYHQPYYHGSGFK